MMRRFHRFRSRFLQSSVPSPCAAVLFPLLFLIAAVSLAVLAKVCAVTCAPSMDGILFLAQIPQIIECLVCSLIVALGCTYIFARVVRATERK